MMAQLKTEEVHRIGLIGSGAHQMFLQAAAAGFGGEDDSAVIKIFPGIRLPAAKNGTGGQGAAPA